MFEMPHMNYYFNKRTRAMVAHDPVSNVVDELFGPIGLNDSLPQLPTPATPPRRRGRTARIANPITKDISEHYKSRGIGPEKTAKIEAALKEGVDVAVIADTVGVSKPTIYIIKTRMRESGQLK